MVEQYRDNLVLIRYHTWWPSSNDPFYQFALQDNNDRIAFYDIEQVTYLVADGLSRSIVRFQWDSLLAYRISFDSPMEIAISGSYQPESRQVDLAISVIAIDTADYSDLWLHLVVTESGIYWPAPNGLLYHNQTMRDMAPSQDGEPLSISRGDTVYLNRQVTLSDTLNPDSCQFVVFVQANSDSLRILQTAMLELREILGISELPLMPDIAELKMPFPNPFNSTAVIEYFLAQDGIITLEIFDIQGRRVATLANGRRSLGAHYVTWNAAGLSSGIYICRLRAGEFDASRRLALIK